MKIIIALVTLLSLNFALAQSAADALPERTEIAGAMHVINPSTGMGQMLGPEMETCTGEQCKAHKTGNFNLGPSIGDGSTGRHSPTAFKSSAPGSMSPADSAQ